MAKFKCNEGEKELGRWTTNFLPHGGGRYTGQLTITDQRLVFHAQFDTSVGGIVGELFFVKSDEGNFISIPREKIKKIEPKTGLLKKRVIVSTDNEQTYIIDNGMLSIKSILGALGEK